VKLCRATLGALPDAVRVPAYDLAAISPGIVHIGVGNFHRSHLAVYIDDVLASEDRSWGIRGVGLMPSDRRVHDALAAQDHLYSVVTMHDAERRDLRVIGSLVDHLLVEDDLEAVIEAMAAPETRIISLTVTEGGYFQGADGSFDATDDDIRADAADPHRPRTAFGLVVEALARRRRLALPPVTVMSCDNLPGNGGAARSAVLGMARLVDETLADWIEKSTTFPDSMVDRITPATTPELISSLADDVGIRDAWPVPAEPFSQWILEDAFAAGRPALDHVGVQLVDDVAPYELMKLRLLNGAHQVIAHLGIPAGHVHVHEALADDDILTTVRAYLEDEARPTLRPVPDVDLDDYVDTLLERFANPAIADTLERIATDAHHRLRQFVVPVVAERAARGEASPIARQVLAAAKFPHDQIPGDA
jgi:mannitol 2-dehydrogenase